MRFRLTCRAEYQLSSRRRRVHRHGQLVGSIHSTVGSGSPVISADGETVTAIAKTTTQWHVATHYLPQSQCAVTGSRWGRIEVTRHFGDFSAATTGTPAYEGLTNTPTISVSAQEINRIPEVRQVTPSTKAERKRA